MQYPLIRRVSNDSSLLEKVLRKVYGASGKLGGFRCIVRTFAGHANNVLPAIDWPLRITG
jgi:hypothetical protein